MGLNIRIVKPSPEFIKRAQIDLGKSFFITEGYSGIIDDCQKKMVIQHCPFCGVDLKKFYKSDDYVQEIVEP